MNRTDKNLSTFTKKIVLKYFHVYFMKEYKQKLVTLSSLYNIYFKFYKMYRIIDYNVSEKNV